MTTATDIVVNADSKQPDLRIKKAARTRGAGRLSVAPFESTDFIVGLDNPADGLREG